MANKGLFKYHTDFWVEKYRPQTLNEYLGNDLIKEKFKEILSDGLNCNLLLSGPPGCGKSSFAHIIAKTFDYDFKAINASDDNNIETVRTTITRFCVTSGFSKIKILFLEEFSAFTKSAQYALKATMEQFSENTRFVLTCNEIEDVNDAIKSRCQHFSLVAPDKKVVKKRMLEILNLEKVDFEEDEVDIILNYNYPDLRQILNDLQKQVIGKVLKLDKEYFRFLTYQNKVTELLKSVTKDNLYDVVLEIRQLIADTRIRKYILLYRFLFDNSSTFVKDKSHNVAVPLILAKYLYQDTSVPDKEINLIACLTEICETLTS